MGEERKASNTTAGRGDHEPEVLTLGYDDMGLDTRKRRQPGLVRLKKRDGRAPLRLKLLRGRYKKNPRTHSRARNI